MKKFRLLLLDANIVIQLFEQGLWGQFIEKCEVLLSRIVAEREARFFETNDGKFDIDLTADIAAARVQVVDASVKQVADFKNQFDSTYLDRLDPGESESLVYMVNSPADCLITSADSIVFRVLGRLDRAEQGISLEELLDRIGLGRKLEARFGRDYREHWTREGATDRIRGRGMV